MSAKKQQIETDEMSINKIVIGISAGLIILTGAIFALFKEKKEKLAATYSRAVNVEKTWKLPGILEEVSGIAFLSDNRIAAVQDERGSIFIYNLETSEIEERIDFAGAGDFEGIAVNATTAFVLRSDGTVYKVKNFETSPNITEHSTSLTRKHDVEGLCYDSQHHRLLLAIKGKEPNTDKLKGVYAVDPETMKMEKNPVFKLSLEDPVFAEVDEKKAHKKFRPSELNIHTETGLVYMLEATTPKLLILDSEGNSQNLYLLDQGDFPQPEGLTFDRAGNMYISNEGKPATIHRVSINN